MVECLCSTGKFLSSIVSWVRACICLSVMKVGSGLTTSREDEILRKTDVIEYTWHESRRGNNLGAGGSAAWQAEGGQQG